jgi:bifunctional non-homologous end joining protein LigD
MRAVSLRSRCCIIDGEAVACGEDGFALFERIRYRRHDGNVFIWAFDILELNGDDLTREPLERRNAKLARLLARAGYVSVQSDRTAKRSFYGIVPLLKFKLIAVKVENEQTNG